MGKVSYGEIVTWGMCHMGKSSERVSVIWGNCPMGEKSYGGNVT